MDSVHIGCERMLTLEQPVHRSKIGAQMLNIGLWGQGPTDAAAFVALNRDLEARLEQLRRLERDLETL